MRLIIVSNSLPIKIEEQNSEFTFTRSSGGLATGLSSLDIDIETLWIGFPGIFPESAEKQAEISKNFHADNLFPVFISPEQYQDYYEGYSNSTLWPLCHYFFVYVECEKAYWKAYQEVNQLFLDELLKIAQPDDLIWVQDYQLMLLPTMIRQALPDISIGYFHHIPFPSYELFRILPERAALLDGLLGADLIGFHTFEYMRHFDSSVYRILGLECKLNEISVLNRKVYSDVFPMGINYDLYYNSSDDASVQELMQNYTEQFANQQIILSVDRLDYSKGLLNRLKAFAVFLENHLEYIQKISLVIVLVPSRDCVDQYNELKTKLDETIGAINGKYSQMSWIPIYYFYKNLPFEELVALYNIAHVALVTPLRDGMNLVAKEFVATKKNKKGVLILSEMAGSAIELSDAILINPNNTTDIENALLTALEMPEPEQMERMEKMQAIIKKQSVQKWAKDFIKELIKIKAKNTEIKNKFLYPTDYNFLKKAFSEAKERLILLDYDGTLVSYNKDPQKASPTASLKELLLKLSQLPSTEVIIISGRDIQTLERWLGDLPIRMVAEHGAYFKDTEMWVKNATSDNLWKDDILTVMQDITDKTSGSFIEEKDSALVWHYRKVDNWLANLRVNQLVEMLIYPCSKQNLQIMKGNKIVEVKVSGVSKGDSVRNIINKKKYDFILCAGDDTTDEDMFRELSDDSVTIKIGQVSEEARFNIPNTKQFLDLLTTLVQ